MQYRLDKNGNKISAIGYGCMRFSKKGPSIDLNKAEKEVLKAVELGINYFDTAYIYPGSEAALGEIIKRNNLRDKIYIADKLPQYLVNSKASIDKFFGEHLKRLQTDYIDYYLMHHMTDLAGWEKLKKNGIIEWIEENKANGRIRNIGFSYHGNSENFIKILDDYDWDFCLIQYNYVDENTQAGVKGLKHAASKGIPVMIMEPLRGGKLVDLLPDKAKKTIASHPNNWSAAEWAFRWLWNQPEVTCVLSGMNSIEMIEENCKVASDALPNSFGDEEFSFIDSLRTILLEKTKVNCTGCGYCMPCPKGVDIPGTFRCYNHMFSEKKMAGRSEYIQSVSLSKTPAFASQCIGCGKCMKHCPQELDIINKLKEADKALRIFPYNIAIKVMRKVMLK